MQIIVKPELHTNRLGGVDIPSVEVLKQMHDSQYILHAAGGKLTPRSGRKDVITP